MERKELRLSTTLCEEWYNMIERITNNVRHDQKPLKRRKLSPCIENDCPIGIEKLITPMVPDDIVEGQQTLEYHAIASELLRSSNARMRDCEEGRFRLRFKNKLAQPIFIGDMLTSEKGNKLIVNLEDVHTGEIVTTGPWAFAELEVVVLYAGLTSGNWTQQEFEGHIWGNPLVGKLDIKLTDGEGSLGEVFFGFSYTKFKVMMELGVRVSPRNSVGLRIHEARTEPFKVTSSEHKYMYRPTLGSEVGTLQHLSKGRFFHKDCIGMGIFIVEDLLR